jgi:hypothetical protein
MTPTVIIEKGQAIAGAVRYPYEFRGGTEFKIYKPGSFTEVAGEGSLTCTTGKMPIWVVRPVGASAWVALPGVAKWQDAIAELVHRLENEWRENPPRPERAASVNGKSIE